MGHTDLFHCNDQNRCNQFLEKGQMIYSTEDGHWLGSGMYFWDSLANALFWKKEKDRKDPENTHIIVKSCVSLERCLDLTDDEMVKNVYETWEDLSEKIKSKCEEEKKHLGVILNYLFDDKAFAGLPISREFSIIKTIGEYERFEDPLFFYNTRKLPRPTNKHRIIYNVKNEDCILFSREVDTHDTRKKFGDF